nr:MAG TPA: hypothetical protein [Caudoviricetes sp.]
MQPLQLVYKYYIAFKSTGTDTFLRFVSFFKRKYTFFNYNIQI